MYSPLLIECERGSRQYWMRTHVSCQGPSFKPLRRIFLYVTLSISAGPICFLKLTIVADNVLLVQACVLGEDGNCSLAEALLL
jgi:hypothetical protein